MKYKLILVTLSVLVMFGCSKTKSYFNGEVSYFDGFPQTDSLQSIRLEFEDIYTGDMYVYDSIMGFLSGKYPDHYFSVFNPETGKHLLDACKKGNGPHEFLDLTGFQQYETKDSQIRIWLREVRSEKFFLINLPKSVQEKRTVVDTIIDLKWTNSNYFPPNSFSFILDDGKVIIKNQAYKKDEKLPEYIPPTYYLYDMEMRQKIKDIVLYKEPFINTKDKSFHFDNYLHSLDRVKPDKTKVAMAMEMLCQINILDISTGKLKGYRLKDTPDFNDLHISFEDMRGYYIDITVDDQYIYAFYSGKRLFNYEEYSISSEVHVFDWEGNPIRKLLLSNEGKYLRVDPVQKKLYIKNDADEVFCYDMKDKLNY